MLVARLPAGLAPAHTAPLPALFRENNAAEYFKQSISSQNIPKQDLLPCFAQKESTLTVPSPGENTQPLPIVRE